MLRKIIPFVFFFCYFASNAQAAIGLLEVLSTGESRTAWASGRATRAN